MCFYFNFFQFRSPSTVRESPIRMRFITVVMRIPQSVQKRRYRVRESKTDALADNAISQSLLHGGR